MTKDYWRIFAEDVPADIGLSLTPAQIDYLTDALKGAHENYGMSHGHDAISSPREDKIERLTAEIKRERDKVHCMYCDGKGTITTYGPCHSATSQCCECRGEGRYSL